MKNHLLISYCFFPSSLGVVGIAWTEQGILGLQLPERNQEETRKRLLNRFDKCIEVKTIDHWIAPWVADSIRRVQLHLGGDPQDFTCVPLDLNAAPNFHQRVYEAARTIPSGVTKTYGEIAREVGVPNGARAVGQALGRNPIALIVPCHRVVAANGKPGGFSAFGGLSTKEKMLLAEGVSLRVADFQVSLPMTIDEVNNVTR
jgi:methylated-DNA-[protein]-cysteine S-methyltransferase